MVICFHWWKLLKIAQSRPKKLLKITQNCSKLLKADQKSCSKLPNIAQNYPKLLKIAQNLPNFAQFQPNFLKTRKVAQNCSKLLKIVGKCKHAPKKTKIVKQHVTSDVGQLCDDVCAACPQCVMMLAHSQFLNFQFSNHLLVSPPSSGTCHISKAELQFTRIKCCRV